MSQYVYIDTSMLVKLYLPEMGSLELDQRVCAEQPIFLVSELVKIEFISALRRRRRQGTISEVLMHVAHNKFLQDVTTPLITLERLDSAVVQKAMTLLNELTLPLATLDALHLATAIQQKVELFFTADVQLSRAAQSVGLTVWPEFP
jgi:predicted nucleic acid-binding protein